MESALSDYESAFRTLLGSLSKQKDLVAKQRSESENSNIRKELISNLRMERKQDIANAMNRIRDELSSELKATKSVSQETSVLSSKTHDKTDVLRRDFSSLQILLSDAMSNLREHVSESKQASKERISLRDENESLKAKIIQISTNLQSMKTKFKMFRDNIEKTGGLSNLKQEKQNKIFFLKRTIIWNFRISRRCFTPS